MINSTNWVGLMVK